MRIGVRWLGTVLFGCLNLALLGCGNTSKNGDGPATDGVPTEDGTDATNSDTSSGTGGGSGSGGGGGSGGANTDGSVVTGDTTGTTTAGCLPGIPATSQVPRLLNREYDNIVRDLLDVSSVDAMGGGPPSSLLAPDSEGDITSIQWEAYLAVADKVAATVMAGENRSRFISCDPAEVATCYEDTIRTFGRQMFRRPLTDEEVTRFMAFTEVDPAWTSDQIAEAILFAFLSSPSFILVPELSAVPEASSFKLSSYEVATRLSLMLWGSTPDSELSEVAEQDSLVTSEQILAQAQRMIQQRDKAAPQVSAAHDAYLHVSNSSYGWWRTPHDPETFPSYTDAARDALEGEVNAFFEEVAYEGGSFQDLFLSNVAFVNRDSAPLYGLDADDYGAELTRVELDATDRPGILTRAGFLSSYSKLDTTSPILRGAFVAYRVLGVDIGAPTPDAGLTPLPDGDYTTQRQIIEALTSVRADCAACHALFNPAGFVLENFDPVGSWQDVDPLGGDIDPTADVTFADGSVRTISSPLELMQAIAADPMARHLYAESLVSYFTGRAPNESEACAVDAIAAKLATGSDYTMLDLVVDLTQMDSFRLRTVSAE